MSFAEKYNSKKRLESIGVENIRQGAIVKTFVGEEKVIRTWGHYIASDLTVQTVIHKKMSNSNVLIETLYQRIDENKNALGGISINYHKEGTLKYDELVKREKEIFRK